MADKPPSFTVSDRRKFTIEGDLRDETTQPAAEETTPAPASETTEPTKGPRLVTQPPPPEEVVEVDEEEAIPEPTAQESAEQHAAYRQSSEQLDSMLRQTNPGMGPSAAVTMEHIIQSMYISAVVAMGAATEPGQKPRIDIVGARQSIDMLAVLQEKTKGNLTEKEQRLLQNALFELRMMFLEITNAIAQQAQNPPKGTK
ncbi:MAG TPA: DUF1844 domain-containing protein [Silvibacterium sp.]|jgi:hypothetical protein|nr:DUF1844 domain-containing protein [Silvibacterium sp.]